LVIVILIDTSIWIAVFRDRSGGVAQRLGDFVALRTVATAAVIRCEVLQGALNDAEWNSVTRAFLSLEQLPIPDETWIDAARMSYELRRKGKTIRSTIDCCIAQLALNHKAELLHNDRDFEAIATIRPLNHIRLDLTKASS
jgi:predicted nucleic acid-binding protein